MFLNFGQRVLKSDSLVTSLQVNSLLFSKTLLSLSLLMCFFFFFLNLFTFGCSGYLLLHGLFSSRGDQGLLSSWWCAGLSFLWLLLSQSAGSRTCGLSSCGFQALEPGPPCMGLLTMQHVGSSWTRDQTCVSCTGGRILIH